jgi:hypothetical protein
MGLEQFGNWGYQIGAVGIVAVTVTYFIIVRWWTDILGRVLAGVLGTTSLVLTMSTLRMLHVSLPDFFLWRAAVFWLFAIAVWAGLSTMVWSQFYAPKVRHRERLTTPQRREHEETDLAHPWHDRDGDSDSLSGGHG